MFGGEGFFFAAFSAVSWVQNKKNDTKKLEQVFKQVP